MLDLGSYGNNRVVVKYMKKRKKTKSLWMNRRFREGSFLAEERKKK